MKVWLSPFISALGEELGKVEARLLGEEMDVAVVVLEEEAVEVEKAVDALAGEGIVGVGGVVMLEPAPVRVACRPVRKSLSAGRTRWLDMSMSPFSSLSSIE